tara:strand:- start:658 stop:933 length:276 start_codon:yes stop_codon:yes gene_type:complete
MKITIKELKKLIKEELTLTEREGAIVHRDAEDIYPDMCADENNVEHDHPCAGMTVKECMEVHRDAFTIKEKRRIQLMAQRCPAEKKGYLDK